MKILILFAILSTSVFLSVAARNNVPFSFKRLNPGNPGIRAKTEGFPNTQSVKLNFSINSDNRVDGRWQYSVTASAWTEGNGNTWYAYENPDVILNVGDHVYYESELITNVVLLNGSGEYVIADS